MDTSTALGYCPNCHESMITENGTPKCFNCSKGSRPKHIVKPPPAIDVPNDVDFQKMTDNPVTYRKANLAVSGGSALDALNIMRTLPMPKNMQEFKQIQKIIKLLEKLVGEDHAD